MKLKISQRKFTGMIIGIVVLTAVLIVISLTTKNAQAITPAVLIFYFICIVFLITAYIGGNVFKAWVTSKHFKSELLDKGEEGD